MGMTFHLIGEIIVNLQDICYQSAHCYLGSCGFVVQVPRRSMRDDKSPKGFRSRNWRIIGQAQTVQFCKYFVIYCHPDPTRYLKHLKGLQPGSLLDLADALRRYSSAFQIIHVYSMKFSTTSHHTDAYCLVEAKRRRLFLMLCRRYFGCHLNFRIRAQWTMTTIGVRLRGTLGQYTQLDNCRHATFIQSIRYSPKVHEIAGYKSRTDTDCCRWIWRCLQGKIWKPCSVLEGPPIRERFQHPSTRFGRSDNPIFSNKLILIVLEAFSKEAILWAQLSHPNVLPFCGIYCPKGDQVALVSPWMEQGNVREYLNRNPAVLRLPLVCTTIYSRGISHIIWTRYLIFFKGCRICTPILLFTMT